jgi:hypothetical protein
MGSALLKADSAGLVCAAQKDGTLRVTYSGWDDAKGPRRGGRCSRSGTWVARSMCSGSPAEPIDFRALLVAYMAGRARGVRGRGAGHRLLLGSVEVAELQSAVSDLGTTGY